MRTLRPLPIDLVDTPRLPSGELSLIDHLRLQLTLALQTSLNIEELLAIFSKQVKRLFGISGVAFSTAEPELSARTGETALHHLSYRLCTADEKIGDLSLYSRHRLSEDDLLQIEVAVSCMVYPLNNASKHHNAIIKAHRDPLTSLGNRRAMNAAIRREISRASRHHSPMSILMVDIDNFKPINDNYGHAVGDKVIACVADVLKNTAREADNAFRYGGEEFVVLLDDTDSVGAHIVAERIRQRIASLQPQNFGIKHPITVSVGCATMLENETICELTERADNAMYLAKSGGKNCVCAA